MIDDFVKQIIESEAEAVDKFHSSLDEGRKTVMRRRWQSEVARAG